MDERSNRSAQSASPPRSSRSASIAASQTSGVPSPEESVPPWDTSPLERFHPEGLVEAISIRPIHLRKDGRDVDSIRVLPPSEGFPVLAIRSQRLARLAKWTIIAIPILFFVLIWRDLDLWAYILVPLSVALSLIPREPKAANTDRMVEP